MTEPDKKIARALRDWARLEIMMYIRAATKNYTEADVARTEADRAFEELIEIAD